uniref:Serine carboxypeptidase n=1 Tax=Oryza sativa subsp. japonica TaxID=39947 RepID=Q53PB1_ORYSJ|nr:Serine carboxypeptidase [Oryza sativa Japonica Group]
MAVRLCCCCFLLFVTIAAAGGSLTRTNVATLPGFDGALPSRLETGYVTVDEENGAELFYYFIESEGDPSTDPVLLWITGGDRCSVLSALFFEIGPLKLVIEPYNGSLPRLHYHPYSWTKVASILFVDSPVGAGFSFSRDPKGYDVGDVSASMQLIKLLREWFTEYPHYLSNPFYVGGDSYAGKIVPFIVQKISEDIEAGVRPTFNLKMIMEHCEGEDYDNPSNVICQQALARFDST